MSPFPHSLRLSNLTLPFKSNLIPVFRSPAPTPKSSSPQNHRGARSTAVSTLEALFSPAIKWRVSSHNYPKHPQEEGPHECFGC
jgi:hypothetical protein